MGRTECNRVVNFQGPARLVGQMVDVRVTQAMHYSLRGEVLPRRRKRRIPLPGAPRDAFRARV